ncbi:Uncharacterized protein TCM_042598 [Theobroma cacao]|uniref:C2 domain-containing protein n=1 Tax=Theobroma cacao TaxID=3641 RepID=A0A061FMI1_THECC|nr:Uncharacterized protein TCM_042598 [Theobroma cacao]
MVESSQNLWIGRENRVEQVKRLYPPSFIRNFRKEEPDVKRDYILILIIHSTEGIDPPSQYPGVTSRNYRVFASIQPGTQYLTEEAGGYPDVIWNERFDIPLKNRVPLQSNFLSLEVIRVPSKCDPGPSRGVVVVGRAKVPFPKEIGKRQCNRLGLARFVEGAVLGEGHITVSMILVENLRHTAELVGN